MRQCDPSDNQRRIYRAVLCHTDLHPYYHAKMIYTRTINAHIIGSKCSKIHHLSPLIWQVDMDHAQATGELAYTKYQLDKCISIDHNSSHDDICRA